MRKKILTLATAVTAAAISAAACFGFTGCAAKQGGNWVGNYYPDYYFPTSPDGEENGGDNYQYGSITESPFIDVAQGSSSYFSLDRNTAGYSYVRRQIENDYKIAADSVRVEELINYFDYS